MLKPIPIDVEFWSLVDSTTTPYGCWFWKGRTNQGYGKFPMGGINFQAHRFAFELTYGELDENVHIHHECHVRRCCNPKHLKMLIPGEHISLHHYRRYHEFWMEWYGPFGRLTEKSLGRPAGRNRAK